MFPDPRDYLSTVVKAMLMEAAYVRDEAAALFNGKKEVFVTPLSDILPNQNADSILILFQIRDKKFATRTEEAKEVERLPSKGTRIQLRFMTGHSLDDNGNPKEELSHPWDGDLVLVPAQLRKTLYAKCNMAAIISKSIYGRGTDHENVVEIIQNEEQGYEAYIDFHVEYPTTHL